eukprot:Ihof_evm1s486 gene=Ihof_evmTU1s486
MANNANGTTPKGLCDQVVNAFRGLVKPLVFRQYLEDNLELIHNAVYTPVSTASASTGCPVVYDEKNVDVLELIGFLKQYDYSLPGLDADIVTREEITMIQTAVQAAKAQLPINEVEVLRLAKTAASDCKRWPRKEFSLEKATVFTYYKEKKDLFTDRTYVYRALRWLLEASLQSLSTVNQDIVEVAENFITQLKLPTQIKKNGNTGATWLALLPQYLLYIQGVPAGEVEDDVKMSLEREVAMCLFYMAYGDFLGYLEGRKAPFYEGLPDETKLGFYLEDHIKALVTVASQIVPPSTNDSADTLSPSSVAVVFTLLCSLAVYRSTVPSDDTRQVVVLKLQSSAQGEWKDPMMRGVAMIGWTCPTETKSDNDLVLLAEALQLGQRIPGQGGFLEWLARRVISSPCLQAFDWETDGYGRCRELYLNIMHGHVCPALYEMQKEQWVGRDLERSVAQFHAFSDFLILLAKIYKGWPAGTLELVEKGFHTEGYEMHSVDVRDLVHAFDFDLTVFLAELSRDDLNPDEINRNQKCYNDIVTACMVVLDSHFYLLASLVNTEVAANYVYSLVAGASSDRIVSLLATVGKIRVLLGYYGSLLVPHMTMQEMELIDIAEDTRMVAMGLRLVRRLARFSHTVREDILKSWQPMIEELIHLLGCPLDDTLKASILRTLTAMGRENAPVAHQIWMLIVQTNLLCGLVEEYRRVGITSENYAATISLIRLLVHLLEIRTPTCMGPPQTWLPFVRFVSTVFVSLDGLAYRNYSHKWQLAKWCLYFFQHFSAQYIAQIQDQTLVIAGPESEVTAMILDCGGPSVLRATKLLLDHAVQGNAFDPNRPTVHTMGTAASSNLGLYKLKLTMECVVIAIFRYYNFVLANQRAMLETAANSSTLSLAPPFAISLLSPVYKLGTGDKVINAVTVAAGLVGYTSSNEMSRLSIDLLLRLSKSRAVSYQLMPLLRGCQEDLTNALTHRLNALEPETDLAYDYYHIKEESEVRQAHLRQLNCDFLLHVVELLLTNIQTVPYPNLAHMCLGYNLLGRAEISDLSRNVTCLHSLVDMMMHDQPMGPLSTTNPQLCEKAYELLYELCSDGKTGPPTMQFLREKDFFATQLEKGISGSPKQNIQPGSRVCGEAGCGRVSDCTYKINGRNICDKCFCCQFPGCSNPANHYDTGRAYCNKCILDKSILSYMYQQTWLLKLVAMEVQRMKCTKTHPREVRKLLGILLLGNTQYDSNGTFPSRVGRQCLPELLDYIRQQDGNAREEDIEEDFRTILDLANPIFRMQGSRGDTLVDIVHVADYLRSQGFQDPDALYIMRNEYGQAIAIERLVQLNSLRERHKLQSGLLTAWCQLLECSMAALPCLPPPQQQEATSRMSHDLFHRLRAYSLPLFVDTVSRALLVVISKLSQLRNSHPGGHQILSTSTSQEYFAQLSVVIETAHATDSQTTRVYLYGIFMKLVAMIQTAAVQNEVASNFKVLEEEGRPLHSFVERASLDTSEGDDVTRTVAIGALGALLVLDQSQTTLKALRSEGYLAYLVGSIEEEDGRLVECLSEDTESLAALVVHGAKMSLLLRIAETPAGASALLMTGIVSFLSLAQHLVEAPAPKPMERTVSVTTRCHVLALWAIRVVGAMVTTLGPQNADVMGQVAVFIEGKTGVLVNALCSSVEDSHMALEMVWLTSGLVHALFQHPTLVDKIGNALKRLHKPMLMLLAKYGGRVQWLTSQGGVRSVSQAKEDIMVHALCGNVLAYCRYLMGPVGGPINVVLTPYLTPAHIGNPIQLDSSTTVEPPPLGLAANYLQVCLATLNNTIDVVQLNVDKEVVSTHEELARLLFDNLEASLYLLWRHLTHYLNDETKTAGESVSIRNRSVRGQPAWKTKKLDADELRELKASAVATLAPILSHCERVLVSG